MAQLHITLDESTLKDLMLGNRDQAVQAFQQRPLVNTYPSVIVDAIYTKAREDGAVRHKGMLIAIGVNGDGQREVLGSQAGDGESQETWTAFFRQLKERGLQGLDLLE